MSSRRTLATGVPVPLPGAVGLHALGRWAHGAQAAQLLQAVSAFRPARDLA